MKTMNTILREYIEAYTNYTQALSRLLKSEDLAGEIHILLNIKEYRGAAINVLNLLKEEQLCTVFKDILDLAIYTHGNTHHFQTLVLKISSTWIENNFDKYIEPILLRRDYEEYTGLLYLFNKISKNLALEIAQRAVDSEDEDLIDVGRDYISKNNMT